MRSRLSCYLIQNMWREGLSTTKDAIGISTTARIGKSLNGVAPVSTNLEDAPIFFLWGYPILKLEWQWDCSFDLKGSLLPIHLLFDFYPIVPLKILIYLPKSWFRYPSICFQLGLPIIHHTVDSKHAKQPHCHFHNQFKCWYGFNTRSRPKHL